MDIIEWLYEKMYNWFLYIKYTWTYTDLLLLYCVRNAYLDSHTTKWIQMDQGKNDGKQRQKRVDSQLSVPPAP